MEKSFVESSPEVAVDLTERTAIRVLHVDDEPDFLKVAKKCLELQGRFEVDTAASVEEAAKKIKERKFDVILSDYQMPQKDGLAFLRELRSEGNNIPFIIFTGKGREEAATKALNYGADHYFSKFGDQETVYCELAHGILQAVHRKRMEQMLRESEQRYRNLVENSKDSIVVIDLKGKVLFANKATEVLTGYSMEEGIGMNVRRITPMRYWPRSLSMLLQAKKGRPIAYFESFIKRKDGRLVPVESGGQAILKDGKVVGVQIITRNIIDRKRNDAALKESEANLTALIDNTRDFIWSLDTDMRILALNKSFKKQFLQVYGVELCRGMPILERMPEEKEVFWRSIHERTLAGEQFAFEQRFEKAGVPLDIEYSTNPIVGGDRRITGVAYFGRDISERKKADERIRESQQKFQRLFTHNPEATCFLDSGYLILDINPRFTELFGFPLEEIKGKNINAVLVPEDKIEEGKSLDKKATNGYSSFETVRKKRNGSLIPVSISAAPMIIGEKLVGYVATYEDISERRNAEQKIHENQLKFEGLFMRNPEATCYVDSNSRILDVNSRFEKLFGYSCEEIRGKCIDDVVVQKDKLEEAMMLGEKAKTGYVYFDTARKRKDGALVPVSISVAPMFVDEKLAGYVAIYKDISRQKKAEEILKELNEKLRVVGSLTRHDIRNKLAASNGYIYLLKKRLANEEQAMQGLNGIETCSKQVLKILEFSRAYEQLGAEKLAYVDVEKCVDQAAALFIDLKRVRIDNECHGLMLLADSLLTQLFYNLIDNSLKYGQEIAGIRIHYKKCGESLLRLTYEDNGVGISEKDRANLFKEGYGKGTGYGLYLIRKICEAYGWTIKENGTEGKGVRFVIEVPKTDGKSPKQKYIVS